MTALLCLAGCAVGPDFKKPDPPADAGYSVTALPGVTAAAAGSGGEAPNLVFGQDVPFDWWTGFGSPALDGLVKAAFRNNPTIASAQAALRQAQEQVYAQQGAFFPSLTGNYSFQRQKVAGNQGSATPGAQGNGTVIQPSAPAAPTIYSLHTAQLSVGFDPDVFGANRRQVESLEAQAELQRDQLQATYVSLAANVVTAAIQEASTRDQIAAVQSIIAADSKAVDIVSNQVQHGYAMRIDLAAADSALAQAKQLLPPLDKQLHQTRDLLRALVGVMPTQEIAEIPGMAAMTLPKSLPVSLPSKIVQQRPDVRAAEEQLRSANAQVGIAIAARLPQFALTAADGGVATQFNQLFSHGGPFWSVIGDVSAPIFDGNGLLHRERAADQALRQADAQYRSTVITAYQNIADSLQAIAADAAAYQAASDAEQAARVAFDLTRRQSQAGYVPVLTLLAADVAYQQTTLSLLQSASQRLGDCVALYQSLGGGWWNRVDMASDNTDGDVLLDLIR